MEAVDDAAGAKAHPSLGAPGDVIVYVPRQLFGDEHDADLSREGALDAGVTVRVPGAELPNIFAHRQWHAGMLLSDIIYSKQLPIDGKIVLELGAGTGLPSITALKHGNPRFVLATDYDSPPLIARLRSNVEASLRTKQPEGASRSSSATKFRIMGHTWGHCIDDVGEQIPSSLRTEHFDTILLADCIWDGLSHTALVQSLSKLLSRDSEARIYMASGLHTGRDTFVAFIRRAYKAGLCVVALPSLISWPALPKSAQEDQRSLLNQLREADDDALVRAVEHLHEMELNAVSAEADTGTELDGDGQQGARLYVADHRRLSGRRRAFVVEERPDERRDVGGVHKRNRWMTFMALGWRDLQA